MNDSIKYDQEPFISRQPMCLRVSLVTSSASSSVSISTPGAFGMRKKWIRIS